MKNLIVDQPIDKHLKPVKDSDGTASSIELSDNKIRVQDLEGGGGELPDGYTVAKANTKVHTEYLDMHSAFIRTDIPHQLDMSECKEDRVTILAHFSPEISWDELMKRLDNLE